MTDTDMAYEHIDNVDALMAHYVAGSLPAPARVLVESHLEIKPDNRHLVGDLERLAGDALEQIERAEISERERRLASIFASGELPPVPLHAGAGSGTSIFPPQLRHLIGFDETTIPWRTKLPGFKEYKTDIDGCEVSLMWIRPGRAMPAHTHQGIELTLILDGAYTDGYGRYARGDISVGDAALDHRPVAEIDRPCIAFSVLDAPIRLTGSFRQVIGDLIG